MTKEVDFWTLLKAWNTYDRWLSNMLCSFGPTSKEVLKNEKYKVYEECRRKLKNSLDEVLRRPLDEVITLK